MMTTSFAAEHNDTPTRCAERDATSQHRSIFNHKAFGINNSGEVIDKSKAPKLESKQLTAETWADVVRVLSTWKKQEDIEQLGEEEAKAYDKFKEDNISLWRSDRKIFFRWSCKYAVEVSQLANGDAVKRLVRIESGKEVSERRIVVPITNIFDVIHESHRSIGHLGEERTYTDASKKCYNVTQALVKTFIGSCFHCHQKQPSIKPLKGAKKPIVSSEFRDRFQVDLIDMRKKMKKNIYGVIQRWIMTLKDHATGLTYVTSIPRKKAKYVAHELDHIFGLIGYPSIFHTDNGKEFIAVMILQLLKELNPNIITVHGRPRTPRDQGSVESVNKMVKRVLAMIESEVRISGVEPNWTDLLGRTMAAINNQKGRGKFAETAYKAVFGQDYNQHIKCPVSEARKCKTIEERLRVANDPRLAEVTKDLFFLDDEGLVLDDIQDSKHDEFWDKSEDDSGEESGVDVETFRDKDQDDSGEESLDHATKRISEYDGETQLSSKEVQEGVELLQHIGWMTPVKTTTPKLMETNTEPTIEGKEIVQELKVTDRKKDIVTPVSKSTKGTHKYPTEQFRQLYSVDWAWKTGKKIQAIRRGGHNKRHEKEYNFVFPMLLCECCCWAGFQIVPIGDSTYQSDCENSKRWWDTDFIAAFTTLVAHESHVDCHLRSIKNTQLIHCPHPNIHPAESECKSLHANVERLVSVLHDVDHFSVLEINIHRRSMTVYDGLKRELKRWDNHITNILRRCKLMTQDCSSTHVSKSDWRGMEVRKIVISEDNSNFWTVESDVKIQQNDTYNCGPIACMKVMELFRSPEYELFDPTMHDIGIYRHIVMDAFKRLVARFSSDLKVTVRTTRTDLTTPPQSTKTAAEMTSDPTPPDLDCFCFAHSIGMEVIEMMCCKKKLHVVCMIQQHENYGRCPYCQAATKTEDLVLAEVVYRSNGDSTKDDKEVGHWGNGEDKNETKITSKDMKETIYGSNKETNKQTQVTEKRSDVVRKNAMEKKRHHQQQSHERMKRWRRDDINKLEISIGAVVTVQVDARDVTHPQGVLGVVVEAKKNTGGIRVVTEAGLLCATTSMRDYWIPVDKYVIRAHASEECVLSDGLKDVREQIIKGTPNEKQWYKTTIQKAHQLVVGASSPCIRRKCQCKGGRCTRRCRCWDKVAAKHKCMSGCSCNGNCNE